MFAAKSSISRRICYTVNPLAPLALQHPPPPPYTTDIYDERYTTFGRVPFGRMSGRILSYVGPRDDDTRGGDGVRESWARLMRSKGRETSAEKDGALHAVNYIRKCGEWGGRTAGSVNEGQRVCGQGERLACLMSRCGTKTQFRYTGAHFRSFRGKNTSTCVPYGPQVRRFDISAGTLCFVVEFHRRMPVYKIRLVFFTPPFFPPFRIYTCSPFSCPQPRRLVPFFSVFSNRMVHDPTTATKVQLYNAIDQLSRISRTFEICQGWGQGDSAQ